MAKQSCGTLQVKWNEFAEIDSITSQDSFWRRQEKGSAELKGLLSTAAQKASTPQASGHP